MLDSQSPMPLYYQMKQALIQEIENHRWQVHEAIPPERDLTDQYGVSRTTVRQAIGELVKEGFLYRLHGRGTFVAPKQRLSDALLELSGFLEEMIRQGLNPTTSLLTRSTISAPAAVAHGLGLEVGTAVVQVDRLVTVNHSPLLFVRAYLPTDLTWLSQTKDSLSTANCVPEKGHTA